VFDHLQLAYRPIVHCSLPTPLGAIEAISNKLDCFTPAGLSPWRVVKAISKMLTLSTPVYCPVVHLGCYLGGEQRKLSLRCWIISRRRMALSSAGAR
jgi:hypothetical protein